MDRIIEAYLGRYKIISPDITDEELRFVRTHLIVSEHGKNSFYLHAGDIQKSLGFVCSGLLRTFYTDESGSEVTMGFVKENEYATHYSSFSEQQASKYSFQCLESSVMISLPYNKMVEGISNYKNLERYARVFKETITDIQQNRIESLLCENAEQRYLQFIKKHPELFNRISLTHLSSFLGLGRQSLSRIRKILASG